MGNIFSDWISDVPRSFIREILKFTIDESAISFAGGLPNRDLFPLEEIKAATLKVLETAGKDVLQYSTSEGYGELRGMDCQSIQGKKYFGQCRQCLDYHRFPNRVLILLGKTFLNEGDNVVIEEPGYLGAIQAFSIYRSTFFPVPVHSRGNGHRSSGPDHKQPPD